MGSTNGTKVNGIPVVGAQSSVTATPSPWAPPRSGSNGPRSRRRPVSDPLLTFLKYIFLALLYLFFLRVLRAVWVELREPKPAPVTRPGAGARSLRPAREPRTPAADRGRGAAGRRRAAGPAGPGVPARRRADGRPGRRLRGRCSPTTPSSPSSTPGCSAATATSTSRTSGPPTAPTSTRRRSPRAVAMRKGDKLQFGKTTLEVRR